MAIEAPWRVRALNKAKLGSTLDVIRSIRATHAVPPVLALVVCISIGAAARLVALGDVPPSLFIDEIWSSYGPQAFYGSLNPMRWPLTLFLAQLFSGHLFTYELAGDSIFWTRFPTAILGTASIPLMYALASHWFGHRIAAVAALAIAVVPWPLHLARYAVSAGGLVTYMLALLLFLELTLAKKKPWWLLGAGAASVALVSSHAVMKIFLPLFLVSYVFVRRHEFRIQRKLLVVPGALALVMVAFVVADQLWFIFGEEGTAPRILSSLVSYLAFDQGVSLEAIGGVVQRYFSHFSPQFLMITGDPNIKYSTGVGGELGLLGPFFYVGLIGLWMNRKHVVAKTLFIWLLLWPLPSALVVPDNPNAVRGAVGIPVMIGIALQGLLMVFSLAYKSRRTISRSAIVGSAAVVAVAGVLSLAIYFLVWPARPGFAAAFDYGYERAAARLEELPKRPVVVADRWRAEDTLGFHGFEGKVDSIAPGQDVHFDVFRNGPGYFLTGDPRNMDVLTRFGYETNLIERIDAPSGEPRLWFSQVVNRDATSSVALEDLDLGAASKRYLVDSWTPAEGSLTLASQRNRVDEPTITYAATRREFYGRMQVVGRLSVPSESGRFFLGFSSYRDPVRGSPDRVSPFMGAFFRIAYGDDGSYELFVEDRSVDSRVIRRRANSGLDDVTVRITYDYFRNYWGRFEVLQSDGWGTVARTHNYIKQPLYLFAGLMSPEPVRGRIEILSVAD
jgi:hypothetical protein